MIFDKWRENRDYPRVITIIGSGGKTSWMKILRDFFLELGEKVVVTTTTKLFAEDFDWIETVEQFHENFDKVNPIYLGKKETNQKVGFIDGLENLIHQYKKKAIFLIEGDGSKRLPFKVPGDFEPVIINETEAIFLMVGTHSLGSTFETSVHRLDNALEICHKQRKDMVSLDDVYQMILEGYLTRVDILKLQLILNGQVGLKDIVEEKWQNLNIPIYLADFKETRNVIKVSKYAKNN